MTVDDDTGKANNIDIGDKKTPLSPRRVVSFDLPNDDHANEDNYGNTNPLPPLVASKDAQLLERYWLIW
jgi:hypothetical protein